MTPRGHALRATPRIKAALKESIALSVPHFKVMYIPENELHINVRYCNLSLTLRIQNTYTLIFEDNNCLIIHRLQPSIQFH